MALSLADLKKSRSLDFGSITKALEKTASGNQYNDDEGYFKVTRDKAGNGSAVFRFLPAAEGDELPWVQIYSHAFKGPTGKWYIENCLSTIGQEDPVNDYNRQLWEKGEKEKKQASAQKRKLQYHCQIYVVSDPGNRENEGKVFKFKFGKKIFEMIMQKIQPTFADDKPVNVFDLWEGANFKLRMRQVEGFPNYDQSTFTDPCAVADSDEEILKIVNSQVKMSGLLDPKNFKSYEDLEKKLKVTLAVGATGSAMAEVRTAEPRQERVAEAPQAPSIDAAADSDDIEGYFNSIAN